MRELDGDNLVLRQVTLVTPKDADLLEVVLLTGPQSMVAAYHAISSIELPVATWNAA